VGQRSADRPAVTNLGIGDRRGGLGQQAEVLAGHCGVRGQRSDVHRPVALHVGESVDTAQVHEQRRRSETELHQRDQRVPAG
jgi:hypothetical protein